MDKENQEQEETENRTMYKIGKIGNFLGKHPLLTLFGVPFVVGAAGAYGIVSSEFGVNPLEWSEKFEAKRQKIAEKREDIMQEYQDLLDLRDRVLRNAAGEDGKRGLSFEEQATLAERLGYDEPFREGNNFDIVVVGGKDGHGRVREPGVYLQVGDERIGLTKNNLEDYLEDRQRKPINIYSLFK